MSFEPQLLVDKLAKLNESTDSIHTLSKWIQHHHRYARDIASVWADYALKHAPISQSLALVYLANDVMQRTKKKSDVFSIEFTKHIPTVFPALYAKLNSDLRAKVVRVVNILHERHCLPEKPYLLLRKSLQALALPHPSQSSSSSTAVTSAKPDPSFRAPTHPASALRPIAITTAAPASCALPPPLASPTLDPILNIARDIVACKDLVSPLLDIKSRAAMSPAAIRSLITPEFLKKYKHAVSALEFVHQQQTATVKFVEQLLSELDRPPSSVAAPAQLSPPILKHARTLDSSNRDRSGDNPEDPRHPKRLRTMPPGPPLPPFPPERNGAALPHMDHFAFMTTMPPPPTDGPLPSSSSPAPTPAGAAGASPVPDPMELLKKLTSGSTATSGSPFAMLGSGASPSLPAAPKAPQAHRGYSPAPPQSSATTGHASFDPMHFLSMSPPPPMLPGLPGSAELGAPLPPGLIPPPLPHLWPEDGSGVLGLADHGFVAAPAMLTSGPLPLVKGEAEDNKSM